MTYRPQLDKNSATDTTAGYLSSKLVAGQNITLTTNNAGGDETLTIAAGFSTVEVLQDSAGAIMVDSDGLDILYTEVE